MLRFSLDPMTWPDEDAVRLDDFLQVAGPVGEPTLGIIVVTPDGASSSLILWMVGAQVSTKYYSRIYAIDMSGGGLVWQRDLGTGRTALASDAIDLGNHLFLDEASGLIVAVSRGGADSKRLNLLDANGKLLDVLDTGRSLENLSVGGRTILRGYQTQRDYDGHDIADNLMRSWKISIYNRFETGWKYDAKARMATSTETDMEVDSNGPGANRISGRWPFDIVSGYALIWNSGWLVPSGSPEEAYLSRGFQRVGAGVTGVFLDPVVSAGTITRDNLHRMQRATIQAVQLTTGDVGGTWINDSNASSHQVEDSTIEAWSAYLADNPTATLSHSPPGAGGYTYVTFADHQSLNIGLASELMLNLGTVHTNSSTCAGDDPGPIVDDSRGYVAPYIEPAAGHSAPVSEGGTFHVSSAFQFPDYKYFLEGSKMLLPFPGSLYPDDKIKYGAQLLDWTHTDKAQTVGGCAVLDDATRQSFWCWMEQEGYIQGSSILVPSFPEVVTETSTGHTPCTAGPGEQTVTHETYKAHWYTYQVGEVQHTCRTMLIRLNPPPGLDEQAIVDISQRFDFLATGPSGDITSEFQRGAADNVYLLVPVRDANVLLVLRDLRAAIYPSSPGAVNHLPFRAIEVRDYNSLELLTTLVQPEYLDTVTVSGEVVRKWATCGWKAGPDDVVNPPERRAGTLTTAYGEVPWVAFTFSVQERHSDGTTHLWHRYWRVAWLDGVDMAPTVAVFDFDTHDQPIGLEEWSSMAFADDLLIWAQSVQVDGDKWALSAMRLS